MATWHRSPTKDAQVLFCDGCGGVSTGAQRARRRLGQAKATALASVVWPR